jgi:hypothetical protein
MQSHDPLPERAPAIRLSVDTDRLTDEMYAFVTDPRPSRNQRPVVQALSDIHPESVDVMESMLIDGTEERADVAAYVAAVFAGPELARG